MKKEKTKITTTTPLAVGDEAIKNLFEEMGKEGLLAENEEKNELTVEECMKRITCLEKELEIIKDFISRSLSQAVNNKNILKG